LVRPFFDRLDIEIPWLFYPVPQTFPVGPPTVFTDRFWDRRDGFYNAGVGVIVGTEKPYFGPVPTPQVGPLFGSADQWINGVSFADFSAGLLPLPPCVNLAAGVKIARIRQRQSVFLGQPTPRRGAGLAQAQGASCGLAGHFLRQAQTITGTTTLGADVKQAAQTSVVPALLAMAAQAQDVDVVPALVALGEQSQSVNVTVALASGVEQAQAVGTGVATG
jgi:hypothetical protein